MAVRKIGSSWRVDFWFNGKRYRIKGPENSKAGAEAYEAVLRQKLARGESIEKTIKPQEVFTFEKFAWKWFADYVEANNKFSEQRTKRYVLATALIPFFGKFSIDQITAHHIEQFKALALKKGLTRKTINNQLTIFRKCISNAYEWLSLPGTPPRIVWLKCPPTKMDYLSPDECELLLCHAEGIIQEMILTALRTGMRQGEIKGLQWNSIDWENRTITVRHSYCDFSKQLTSPKSNRERYIPMDVDVYEMLSTRKRSTGYVFLDGRKPFDSHRLGSKMHGLCKKSGLRKIGWHTLRHTFASHLVMRGVPLTAIQALMGHATVTTTMRYAHLAPSALRSAIDMLNPKTMLNAELGHHLGTDWIQKQKQELLQEK